ncbi:hypothetical protein Cenrod_0423 [Candidatus Symbiobacter mobilis CR]|uniref:Uncharacterized protein n=1 Tax=Candidatus Symbiobacter mobilis CR TaxID=946483 RepID=U5N8F1_9BURK|nr:hypothetical protein Cenrod_0423 [Candidatus Symbiobacter mobilis CR]
MPQQGIPTQIVQNSTASGDHDAGVVLRKSYFDFGYVPTASVLTVHGAMKTPQNVRVAIVRTAPGMQVVVFMSTIFGSPFTGLWVLHGRCTTLFA